MGQLANYMATPVEDVPDFRVKEKNIQLLMHVAVVCTDNVCDKRNYIF